jgi:hypothetical protein
VSCEEKELDKSLQGRIEKENKIVERGVCNAHNCRSNFNFVVTSWLLRQQLCTGGHCEVKHSKLFVNFHQLQKNIITKK